MDAPRLPAGFETSPVAVGLSGGLDSSVLLHLLAGSPTIRRNGLRAIHVHHGLQRDADAWAAHCLAFCTQLGLECRVMRVQVDHASGLGPEAAARQARYGAFADALDEGEVLALAHHRDDQAETFLLRALRASGPDGLAAMRRWRATGRGWLWRPLLELPRRSLLAYAQTHGLRWLDDASNRDTALDRSFLRHRVLPLLREHWPQAEASLARAATLQAEAVDLLDSEDARALGMARTADPHVLRVDKLQALSRARRARALRRWIGQLGLPPLPAQGLARIEADLLGASIDSQACFEWEQAVVRRWRGLLHADARREPLPADWSVAWSLDTPLLLPTGERIELDRDAVSSEEWTPSPERNQASIVPTPWRSCRVHARVGGERIVLPGRRHSHALKHVLQALGVPPWERARMPLLSDDRGNLLAAGDLVYSATFDAWLRERGATLRWDRTGLSNVDRV